jgi:hypothetical protein
MLMESKGGARALGLQYPNIQRVKLQKSCFTRLGLGMMGISQGENIT